MGVAVDATGSAPSASADHAIGRSAPRTLDPPSALTFQDGPLRIEGPIGSGRSRFLQERFLALVDAGTAPERIALLCGSPGRAGLVRRRIEAALSGGYGELAIGAPDALARSVVRASPGQAHLADAVLSPGERLAMLAERIDELALHHHDFGGNASALLAGIVGRIDALKAAQISAARFGTWAEALDDDDRLREAARRGSLPPAQAAREREFAVIYAAHDRMLADAGLLDGGDLLALAVRLATERPSGSGVGLPDLPRFAQVLVDDADALSLAAMALAHTLAGPALTLVGSEADAGRHPVAARTVLSRDAPAVIPRFWAASNERAQAQAVAAEIEALLSGEDAVAPGRVAVAVPSVSRDGQAIAVALEERAIPHRLVGEAAFFARAEVRDLLAWLRWLGDPADAPAAVRVLARPPVELRSVDIARVTQIARRRKLDMVAALAAATESPQVPPDARERIRACLKLYRACTASFDTSRPDLYVHRLIDRLGLRRRNLFAAQAEVVEQLRALARFGELAGAHCARAPQATARDFAHSIAAVADQSALALAEPEEPQLADAAEVQVVSLDAVSGMELDHLFLLGLGSSLRANRPAPVPAELVNGPGPGVAAQSAAPLLERRLADALARPAEGVVLSHVVAHGGPAEWAESVRLTHGGEWELREEALFGPAESLPSAYRLLLDELLEGTGRAAGRLAELRLDTDLDISHAVARYLEVLKVAALISRVDGEGGAGLADALVDINARIGQAVTSEQREILSTSSLDAYLLEAERDERRRAQVRAARDEPSLARFLPTRGDGVLLSASDIDTYRACPLKYKFARVFRIPQEPTLHQRFGIAVHQVLQRFHGAAEENGGRIGSAQELLGLLDVAWRRQGFGDSDEERQLRMKAEAALGRYHLATEADVARPVWFERAFSFKLGPHLVRGRVDRVDRLPDGGYELIDYKTGRPRSAEALADDVQLSLYTVAAREAWGLEASRGAYLYLLDDAKVAIPGDAERAAWIREVATDVAESIRAQEFEPTPSVSACGFCDYRLACPAAER